MLKLDKEVKIENPDTFTTISFVNGSFLWQQSEEDLPQDIQICPMTHFLDPDSRRCEPCSQSNFGTSQLEQATCVSCGQMWNQAASGGNIDSPVDYQTAFSLCADPEQVYRDELAEIERLQTIEQARLEEERKQKELQEE